MKTPGQAAAPLGAALFMIEPPSSQRESLWHPIRLIGIGRATRLDIQPSPMVKKILPIA